MQDSVPGDQQAALLQQAQQQRLQELQDGDAPELLQLQLQEKQQRLNQRQAALRSVLQQAGISFSAQMSVLKRSHVRQLNPDIVQQRIIKLQEAFGADAVNSILSSAPELLDRKSERMVEYFRGLSQLLGAGDAFALEVVVRCPDLLGHRPEMVQMRLQNMAKVLQVRALVQALLAWCCCW